MSDTRLLRLTHLAKSYGQIEVLKGIDLELFEGEVLALVGENGAGKSTLMRLMAGLAEQTQGEIVFQNEPAPASLIAAERAGIVMVHQEFCLAPHLTVAENVFLGREITRGLFTDRRAMERQSEVILSELGSSAWVRTRLSDLPVSDWQIVELAKAFARKPKIILMDEPTAVLSSQETERLFARIRRFQDDGGSVIFTSHRLDEVTQIADRVAILRDGQIVRVDEAARLSEDAMAEAMVGRPLAEIYPPHRNGPKGAPLLSVRGLTSPGIVQRASLDIHAGEILGVSGLVGSGRTELFEALVGLRSAECRSFKLRGTERHLPTAREAWGLKMAYLTEDRKGKGLLLEKRLAQNLALTRGAVNGSAWIDRQVERDALRDAAQRYDIRAGNLNDVAGALSGGNQQKLLVAKTLATDPDIVVFDEPTRGVDIGAKRQIYQIIADLASAGRAVVVISSEMQEIVGLADRVIVMRQGQITGELSGAAITETEIIRLAMGLNKEASHV